MPCRQMTVMYPRKMKSVDFLLLNVSNYSTNPIFPYAFIQVSALARKNNLSVGRLDLFGLKPAAWGKKLKDAIHHYNPRMIGVTLRQVDSLAEWEYLANDKHYLPARDTRILVEKVRAFTKVPIVVGGFGFTTYAQDLMPYLKPDFGITGEPDHFFEKFEQILKRQNLNQVNNLIYSSSNNEFVFNKRVFYGPLDEPEYNDETADELIKFYKDLDPICVPVEVMRGCPMRCYFCSEPSVKGLKLNRRSLDVVMKDVEFLAKNKGIRKFWFVASELNVTGPQLALDIADRMTAMRESSGIKDIQWFGYLLPKITEKHIIQTLAESGHQWSWNEVQSLCEKNLKETKVPYKVDEALGFYKQVMSQVMASTGGRAPLNFFLGNAFSNPETIVNTLIKIEENQLQGKIGRSTMVPGTRVFPARIESLPPGPRVFTHYSDGEKQLKSSSIIHPTFFSPPKIDSVLGGTLEIIQFFNYVSGTFVTHELIGVGSPSLRRQLKNSLSPKSFYNLLKKSKFSLENKWPHKISEQTQIDVGFVLADIQKRRGRGPTPKMICEIFGNKRFTRFDREKLFCLVWIVLTSNLSEKWARVQSSLSLEPYTNSNIFGSFKWTRGILKKFPSENLLIKNLTHSLGIQPDDIEVSLLKLLLRVNNVNFKSSYRAILIS